MASLCADVLQALDQPPCDVSIVFVGPRTMRSLNREFRGKDYATDVLSFRYGSIGDSPPSNFPGEIVISPAVAVEHARRWRTPVEKEMRKLLVHGILHLLGYDHETDNGEMNKMERRLMRRLKKDKPQIKQIPRK